MLAFMLLLYQAQSFSGTYQIQGGQVPITLTLRQVGAAITGTLTGQTQFQVRASVSQPGRFTGYASNAAGRIYIAGQLDQASGALALVMADVGPDGRPNTAAAQQVLAIRSRGGAGAPQAMPRGNPSSGGSAQDRQLAQLLTRSAWCAFSYNQNTGTSHTDRVVFRANGTGQRSSGGETYNSGANGTVSSQSSGGGAFQWRVANGVLSATDESGQTQQIPLQVARNSNGYPIITANGTEYSMCN